MVQRWSKVLQLRGAREEMTREEALHAWKEMFEEIDKDNWLFVGTINPDMVAWAIKALEQLEVEKE